MLLFENDTHVTNWTKTMKKNYMWYIYWAGCSSLSYDIQVSRCKMKDQANHCPDVKKPWTVYKIIKFFWPVVTGFFQCGHGFSFHINYLFVYDGAPLFPHFLVGPLFSKTMQKCYIPLFYTMKDDQNLF